MKVAGRIRIALWDATLLWACLGILCLCPPARGQGFERVRVSTWYWLNSVNKTQWQRDFNAIKDLGFTDVVLVWGLDAAAFATRTSDSHKAIRDAHRAGLGSYLFVWHARHSALPQDVHFEQVDAAGHSLFAFDAFNPEWRKTQWKSYLQTLAQQYGPEPGLAGYVFDNSFAIGNIGTIDGPAPAPEASYLSYGDAELKQFGTRPPTSPSDPAWAAWTRARQQWWADWASETQSAIRSIDHDPHHEMILEDGENTIDPDTETRTGLKLGRVTPSFSTMNAYWAPSYSDQNTGRLAAGVRDYLGRIRKAIGPDKSLGFTLRLSDDASEDLPGHANHPTIEQIKQAVDAALTMGVHHIDLYGYRMGIYHLDGTGWLRYRPGSGKTYPLTGQIEGKFLVDRPELHESLRIYLHKIQSASPASLQP